jgi:hypothetical protein
MTDFDERLSEALGELPTGAQRPLQTIERRARAIRHRRRTAVAGIAVVAAGAVALPSLGDLAEQQSAPDLAPATTEQLPVCDSWESSAKGTYLKLDQVPDQLRLLWGEDVAPPPTEADMVDFSEAEVIIGRTFPGECVVPDTSAPSPEWGAVAVFDLDDNVIIRRVQVFGPNDDTPPEALSDSRVIDIQAGPMTVIEHRDGWLEAWWPAEHGRHWTAWIRGAVTDNELVELAGSARLVDGVVDLGAWSVADRATYLRHSGDERVHDEAPTSFDVRGPGIQLRAAAGYTEDDLWEQVEVGDEFVDVNGNLGLLKRGPSGELHWVTADGLVVSIFYTGRDGQEALLDLARSVHSVAADDERLTAVWRTEPESLDPDE